MNILLSILNGVVIGLIIGYFLWRKTDSSPVAQNDNNLIYQSQKEKAENLEKLREYIGEHEQITNDDIQKILNISDATAVRYLDELEQEGVIKQVGETGQSVYYIRN